MRNSRNLCNWGFFSGGLLGGCLPFLWDYAGVSRLRTRRGGNENRRMSAIAPSTPSGAHSCYLDFVGSFYFGCSFTAQSCRSAQPGNQPPLFPSINMSGGGSPEGAEVQTCTLFSPLWAFFGTFLSQQKVTSSPPQRRREQRIKSRLVLKSSMGKMLRKAHQSHSKSPRNTA